MGGRPGAKKKTEKGTLFLGELTDIFRFQDDFPNGPHEPLPRWSPQENEPPPLPDSPSIPPLPDKTNGVPAIPSLDALQIATPFPQPPLSSQPDGLRTPNPEPSSLIVRYPFPAYRPPTTNPPQTLRSPISDHHRRPGSLSSATKQPEPNPPNYESTPHPLTPASSPRIFLP